MWCLCSRVGKTWFNKAVFSKAVGKVGKEAWKPKLRANCNRIVDAQTLTIDSNKYLVSNSPNEWSRSCFPKV